MTLRGLPDFGTSLVKGQMRLYRAFERDHWLQLPERLVLAERDDGVVPDLRLSLVRPAPPALSPAPFARLDIGWRLHAEAAPALEALRERVPRAALLAAPPDHGTLRVTSTDALALPAELAAGSEVAFVTGERLRCALVLSEASGATLLPLIEAGTFPGVVELRLRFSGVSPRAPLIAEFGPGEVFDAVGALDTIEARDLVRRLHGRLARLPIAWQGPTEAIEHPSAAEAFADRLLARFAPGAPVPSGRFRWDLSVAVSAERTLSLGGRGFDTLNAYVRDHGAEPLVARRELPRLPPGRRLVRVGANLPRSAHAIVQLGVMLMAPPTAGRPQPAFASARLEPERTVDLLLRLAPGEPLAYELRAFALVSDPATGVRKLDGAPRMAGETYLTLTPEDFGLAFLSLSANAELLDHADVEGTVLAREHDEDAREIAFRLGGERRELAIALARATLVERVALTLVERDGAGRIALALPGQRELHLTPFVVEGYGPRTITLEWQAEEAAHEAAVIEIVAESAADDHAAPQTLQFTRGHPRRRWRYFARSPFRRGFLWRRTDPGGPPGAWQHADVIETFRFGDEASGGTSGDPVAGASA